MVEIAFCALYFTKAMSLQLVALCIHLCFLIASSGSGLLGFSKNFSAKKGTTRKNITRLRKKMSCEKSDGIGHLCYMIEGNRKEKGEYMLCV